MSAQPEQYLSLEEYVKIEESSEIKHEYHDGVAYAMSGASEKHNLIAGAVYRSLGNQLAGKSCRPYFSDFRLKIEAANLYTYPDVSVICGETRLAEGRQDIFINPTLLIEVLSESTEAYDRGKKTELYRTIPSLQEYLSLAQDRPHVEHYSRQGHCWLLREYSAMDEEVVLESTGCTLTLAAIYAQVHFKRHKRHPSLRSLSPLLSSLSSSPVSFIAHSVGDGAPRRLSAVGFSGPSPLLVVFSVFCYLPTP